MATRKFLLKATLLLLLTALILTGIAPMFVPASHASIILDVLCEVPENKLDVLFLGGSSVATGIAPMEMWECSGSVALSLSTTLQAPFISYLYLVEALKRQSPQLVVLSPVWMQEEYWGDTALEKNENLYSLMYQALDLFPLSPEKLEVMLWTAQNAESQPTAEALLPFLRWHARWNQLSHDDVVQQVDGPKFVTMGQIFFAQCVPIEHKADMTPGSQMAESSPTAEHYYRKIIDSCLERGTDVCLLVLPRADWSYAAHMAVQQLADTYGLLFLDLNTSQHQQALALDYDAAFYNSDHLNAYGASVVTRYLSEIFRDAYGLPNHRDDPQLAPWMDEKLAAYHGLLVAAE